MRMFVAVVAMIASLGSVAAEERLGGTIDTITKSAKDILPSMPSLPSVSLPSIPDFGIPDFSDASGKMIAEFNSFSQQVGAALPILEQMGYEVSTFKVTWRLPPKARLRLKSSGATPLQRVEEIAAKGLSNNGVLVSALINSAVAAKRIQSTMKLGAAYLDVDFALPPRVNMKFVNSKGTEKEESRDLDDLEIACK
ncbi:hypothetical protein [Bradyrhizobium sp. SEMIA]|uniref:hypothetical protein n=1 Tax=Bradyrhizobium sp. SEMIA TaxID=2597515 RepID=UPI00223EC7FC|nr:hypothetical protein [Bradyrhizobium sp. SEMIA]